MEAECSVLGAMLISPRALELACDSLDDADFTLPCHVELFKLMYTLHQRGIAVDTVTIVEAARGKLDEIGGLHYISDLAISMPTAANVEFYIAYVRENRQRREFIDGMQQVIASATEGNEYIAAAQGVVDKVVRLGSTQIEPVGSAVMGAVESLGRVSSGLMTGFIALDFTIHGLKAGQLIVVAGCTRMGKTSFALNVALHVASQKHSVAVFSLEMTQEELLQRAVVSLAEINQYEVGQDEAAMMAVLDAAAVVGEMPLYIDDRSGVTVDYIKGQCHRIKPELVVIDYLGLIRTKQRKNSTREQEIAEITRSLKVMAKDLHCPVMLLAQLNRGVDKRADKVPVLSDLRDSGAIEQDADIVIFLHRPAEFDRNADAKAAVLNVAKHRNGVTGDIDMQWDGEHFKYKDAEVEDDEQNPFR